MSSTPFHREDTSACTHLQSLLSQDNTTQQSSSTLSRPALDASLEERYDKIVRWGAKDERSGTKRRKVSPPECKTCSTTLSRPWACLTCPFVGCLSLSPSSSTRRSSNCAVKHLSDSNGDCKFAIDASSGTIYCNECEDTTYSDTFESVYRLSRIRVEEANDHSKEISLIGKGRERGPWKPWTPAFNLQITEAQPNSCRGLRPLLNLSQTCFLSAILQAFLHNPLLKAYFLSDKHNRYVCPNGSKGLAVGKPYIGAEGSVSSDREKGCMCCELDRAFEEFHNDDKSPYGPITMLYAMWHASAELEGYGQQDAHSFFLAALDQIHAHAKGQLSSCNCIAHQTFAGSLLSTVTCSKCSTTSTTIDPILDVQLDFPVDPSGTDSLSLSNMLRKFCEEEKVGDGGKGYDCSKCGGGPGSVALRKLQIRKLPPVLSFQLKRFAHNATSSKVELPVRFPSHLNMLPYVESSSSTEGSTTDLPTSLYDYDLFAVVTHEGKLDNGHYWADVLSGDEWWHCDDDKVTPTTLKEVLGQKAYMLFYVKRSLSYTQPLSKLLSSTQPASVPAPSEGRDKDEREVKPSMQHGGKMPPSHQLGGRGGHAITGMTL